MIFLTIGDLHFKKNNVIEQSKLRSEIFYLIEKYSFDFVVFLGDHLHDNDKVNTTLLTEVIKLFKDVSKLCETIILIGNHDRVNNSDFLGDVHAFTALHEWNNVHIIDTTKKIKIKNMEILCVPYVPTGRFFDAIDILGDHKEIIKDTDLVLAHQEFYGLKFGGMLNEDGDKWPENYPLVISGHIHQNIKIQENIHYTGAPLYFEYGESDTRGLTVYKYENGIFKDKQYELSFGKKDIKKFVSTKSLIEFLENKIDKNNEILDLHLIKLHITDTYENINLFKNYIKKYPININRLMKINNVVIQYNIINSIKEIDVKESTNFYSIVQNSISNNKELLQCLQDLNFSKY